MCECGLYVEFRCRIFVCVCVFGEELEFGGRVNFKESFFWGVISKVVGVCWGEEDLV